MKRQRWVFGQPNADDWIVKIYNLKIENVDITIQKDFGNKIDNFYIPCNVNQAIKIFPFAKSAIITCNDKGKFQEFAMRSPFLSKYVPGIISQIAIKFPCVIKETISCSGYGVYLIKNQVECDERIKKLKVPYIIQEYIHHSFYYVGHFFVLHGKVKYQIYYEQQNKGEFFIKRGNISSIGLIKNKNNKYDDIFSTLFEELEYTGFACIDFCVSSETGECKIFEVNPRLGGSIVNDDQDFKDILLCASASLL